MARRISWGGRRVVALLGVLFGLGSPQAVADSVATGFESAMTELAVAMFREQLGTAVPAQIYVRQPRDEVYGVACAPLSRLLLRKYNGALRDGLRSNGFDNAAIVGRSTGQPGEMVVNLSWRRLNDTHFDVATSIAYTTDANTEELFRSDFLARVDDLSEVEQRCLFRLEEVFEDKTARRGRDVYRSIGNFQETLGRIEAGTDFHLIGRIAGMGDWSLVRMLDQPSGPEVETIGFAFVPRDGLSRDELAARLDETETALAEARSLAERLEAQMAELSGALAEREGVEDALAALKAETEAAAAHARQTEDSLRRQVSELSAKAAALEQDGGSASRALSTQLDAAEEAARVLRRQLDRTEADLAGTQRELSSLRAQLGQEVFLRRRSEQAQETLAAEHEATLAEMARLTEEVDRLAAAGPENADALRQLERRVGELHAALAQARLDVKTAETEIDRLEAELAAARVHGSARPADAEAAAKADAEWAARADDLRNKIVLSDPDADDTKPTPPPSPIRVFERVSFDNARAAWLDLDVIEAQDHAACQAACRADPACKYYTFNNRRNECTTKSGVVRRKPFLFGVSGELTDRTGD